MSAGYPSSEAVARGGERAATTIGEVLHLFSEGATAAILLALVEGPMQTKVLTHQVRGYTARTIYRYLPKLAQLGVVERDEEPSGPAKVLNTLTSDAGNELCAVVERFAQASMTRLPGGQVEPGTWGSLGLLADLWCAGVVDELSRGPKSPTDLVQIQHGMSYHQVSRRAGQFRAAGFLRDVERSKGRQRRYALTEKARRTMGLVAAIGRWRHRHAAADPGLTVEEMATVLRVSLPLAEVPQHARKAFQIRVIDDGDEVALWAKAGADGRIETYDVQPARSDAAATGDLETWLGALVDGEQGVAVSGDEALVRDCLASLYEKLWTPSPF